MRIRRFQFVRSVVIFVLAAVATPVPAWAGPYISEVVLPAAGTTAVEVVGLDAAGATLLVVNASRDRLRVQQAISLPAASQTAEGSGLVVVAGAGWGDAAFVDASPTTTLTFETPLFSDFLPTSLVLIQGHTAIGTGASLGSGSTVSGITSTTPIVDWVSFAPGTHAQAQLAVRPPPAASVAALGIADLPRPTVGTADATALARAVTEDGPVMDLLFTNIGGSVFSADAHGFADFAFSPGLENPTTTPIRREENLALPEPGAGVLLSAGLFVLTRRATARPRVG